MVKHSVKCKYCRKSIEDDSIFCRFCGEKQTREKRKKSKEPLVPKPRQLSTGEWAAQVMADGRREVIKGSSEKEYFDRARAFKAGVLELKRAPERVTLQQAMERYVEKRRAVLSPSTINGYESIKKTRFLAYAKKNVDEIDYQQMINDEAAQDVSARTIKNAWGFVKSALKDAGRTPPELSMPQVVYKDLPFLDFEEIKRFLDAVHGKPCELAALLALHGLRKSELLALTPGKVDLKKLVLHVEGSRVRGSGNVMVSKDTNKSATSRRDVPIMIPRLEELLKEATRGKPEGERLILTNTNEIHTAINRHCKKAGLPLVGVHGLRRSYASLAYHLGWGELQTMRIGGWSDPAVVRKVYTKLAQADVDAGVEKMRNYYGFTTKNEKVQENQRV